MKCDPPQGCVLVAPVDALDFVDCRKFPCPSGISALDIYRLATQSVPRLLRIAFSVRDRVSSMFGVRSIGGFTPRTLPEEPLVGDALHFFTIEEVSDAGLALAARDVHLDTVLSLHVVNSGGAATVCYVCSSVVTKNLFGKVYMAPVSLVHGLIVEYLLQRALSSLDH